MAELPKNYEVIMEIGFACTNGTEFIVANAKKVRDIVRCRDCKWYKPSFMWNGIEVKICCVEEHQPLRNDDFFCAYGERKDDG